MRLSRFLFLILAVLLPQAALAQDPCATSATQRSLFSATATSFPVALNSPDHGNADKVAEYVINIYPAGGTTPVNQQVVSKASATLVAGTTDCYRMTVNRAAPLATNTDYAVRALARGPAGEGALTQFSNPFVFPSAAGLGNVRVPPAP